MRISPRFVLAGAVCVLFIAILNISNQGKYFLSITTTSNNLDYEAAHDAAAVRSDLKEPQEQQDRSFATSNSSDVQKN